MNRDKLIGKIRALRAKTVEAGCTEEEAMAAAAKAAALMAEHKLDTAELEIGNQSAAVRSTLRAARAKMWAYIAYVTNCAMLHKSRGRAYTLMFVGREPGPEIACYLRDVCDRAIDQAIVVFKAGPVYQSRRLTATKRKAVEDFTLAMVERLASRLIGLFRPTISHEEYRKACEVLDRLAPDSRAMQRSERKTRFQAAAAAGHFAGGKVSLSHGVNGGKPVAQLT